MASNEIGFIFRGEKPIRVMKWKVKPGSRISNGTILLFYELYLVENELGIPNCPLKLKSNVEGTVHQLIAKEGDVVRPGCILFQMQTCTHPTVMKDMCAECGADLRELDSDNLAKVSAATSVSMVHSVPELRVSHEEAQQLGQADESNLLKNRKLVLLVDLDQTLIHTTNDTVPPKMKNVYHFQLYGPRSPWYHTRLRPGMDKFLESISSLYELHICTFGARAYAHTIANLLDPNGKYFSHRILSRDECFNPNSKTGNLKALFPCGDSMVCIIDDREDVWNYAPNLVPVKPYHFFTNTGDINAPPGMGKTGENGLLSRQQLVAKSEVNEKEPESSDSSYLSNNKNGSSDSKLEEVHEESLTSDDNYVPSTNANNTNGNEISSESTDCETSDDKAKNNNDNEFEISAQDNLYDTKDNLSKEDSTETDVDVIDDDDYLIYLEEILTVIHKAYYDMYDQMKAQCKDTIPDLKNVIPYVRRKVLKGVNIVFSGVIPTNMPPERSKLWMVAKSLGANITADVVPPGQSSATTHTIAVKWGTSKVNKAKKLKDVHIVTPEWLWNCAERWEHVEERLFLLEKDMVLKPYPQRMSPAKDYRERKAECRPNEGKMDLRTNEPSYPVYDPVTGKKVHRHKGVTSSDSSLSSVGDVDCFNDFSTSFSPLLSFSSQEIADMDREVDDACSEESDKDKMDSDNDGDDDDSENPTPCQQRNAIEDNDSKSSEDSLTGGECPRGWKKKRKRNAKQSEPFDGVIDSDDDAVVSKFPRRELPHDSDKSTDGGSDSDDFNESIGSVDEEMAAAVEREFLSSS